MKALVVLYAAALKRAAFECWAAHESRTLPQGGCAFTQALARARAFPHAEAVHILCASDAAASGNEAALRSALAESGVSAEGLSFASRPLWTRKALFEEMARAAAEHGADFIYVAWADYPFLDPALAASLAALHNDYAAEYSYADGYPAGLAPELLAPGSAAILAQLAGDEPVERDALFAVIQKDINNYDIEVCLAPRDLRGFRLHLACDSKAALFQLRAFLDAGLMGAQNIEEVILRHPEVLRGLPAYYPVQVAAACPQSCTLCPYPATGKSRESGEMEVVAFTAFLDKVVAFSGEAVIGLSLWGELGLHRQRLKLIDAVLARKELTLVIETSGLGWAAGDFEKIAEAVSGAARRDNGMESVSWIVSLDAESPECYREMRGQGEAEAKAAARALQRLFPRSTYVQAVRIEGNEDDIERFYRSWKEAGANVIVQKYDHFAGALPRRQASDLSPVRPLACNHIQRDFPVLLDGSVPVCREDVGALTGAAQFPLLGNVFSDDLETIWKKGMERFLTHRACCAPFEGEGTGTPPPLDRSAFGRLCEDCDEFYTYNF